MNSNKTYLYFFVFCVVSFGMAWYIEKQISIFTEQINSIRIADNYARHEYSNGNITPQKNDLITNPVNISGSLPGTWFFEGQIIARVLDSFGVILGQGPLVAHDEWMTTDDVAFEGVIPFNSAVTSNGFVVIEEDNPRGDINSRSVTIPVRFQAEAVDVSCADGSCGECTIGSIGSSGVCMKTSDTKNL